MANTVVLDHSHTPFLLSTSFNGNCNKLDSKATQKEFTKDKKDIESTLSDTVKEISDLQEVLMADGRFSVLCVFQAMDCAGKDSTIKNVFSGVNPAGCEVHSFKTPSSEDVAHPFMWKAVTQLPRKGMIGVFNRSYYEEVLIVRVHPEFLEAQKLPQDNLKELWSDRFKTISAHEKSWAESGTIVLKFFLNISKDEQAMRQIRRLEDETKQWKFNASDLVERKSWDEYMTAYGDLLKETNQPYAPWFVIPADDKPIMRLAIAQIIRDTLKQLPLKYPTLDPKVLAQKDQFIAQLKKEIK